MSARHPRLRVPRIFAAFAIGATGFAAYFAVGIAFAPSASARTNVDPCGDADGPHVTPGGLHCSAVFSISQFSTRNGNGGPKVDAPRCNPETQTIGAWDFWSQNGEWVTWTGQSNSTSQ